MTVVSTLEYQMDVQAEGKDHMTAEQDATLRGGPSVELDTRLAFVFQGGWQSALHTDQYEVAAQALSEVIGYRQWREMTQRSPFPHFYQLVEASTLLNQVSASPNERMDVVERLVPNAAAFSPRIRDLYMSMLSQMDRTVYTSQFPMTENQLRELASSGDLALLQSPDVAWDVKINRMQTRIEAELKGRKALDRIDKEKEAREQPEQKPSDQDTPPPARDETKPGMDEMQRLKEGETAPAIWTISPAYGGYYKEQSFDSWDVSTNTWRQSGYHFTPHPDLKQTWTAGFDEDNFKMSVNLPANQRTRIPAPYTYTLTGFIENPRNIRLVEKDQNGDLVIIAKQAIHTDLVFSRGAVTKRDRAAQPQTMSGNLSEETESKIQEASSRKHGNIERARVLASYTMRRLAYSNESSLNSVYDSDPDGYIGAIDKFKKADCDVANTYFAALCSRLNIPVRHVVGHMVKGKDSSGNSRITSGTGHAWTEVWDEQKSVWVRVDATPPGDPQLEQDQTSSGFVPGDYGEQEAIGPTDEELLQLEEKLSQLTEQLSYTQEERELSEKTGIDIKDARKIVKEIEQAENTRLPNGERLIDVMAQLWSLITESRMITAPDYTGPLRKREGGEDIEDIVAHKIGIIGGDLDPATRQKEDVQKFYEAVIREMQVYIIGDKSGSMSQTVDGQSKWRFQQQAIYIVVASLDRAQKNIQRLMNRISEPLSLPREVISFRDSDTVDIDLPLSNNLTLDDKVKLWKSLGNQGSGNGDVPAMEHIHNQISTEVVQKREQGKEDDTLRVILACSDGEPDNVGRVHKLAESLGQLNSVVVGVGITETAAKVPVIFNTPHSIGDLARDFPELAVVLGKHVVRQAIKLFPDKTREGHQRSIDAILAKFDRVGMKTA